MPRIDPLQLLKTLSVLLSNKGGIKSSEEVVRLVQLMQKFSKKLVSKSIYIEILRATTSPLLERFLNEKGWDLLNLWFSDSIKTQNWPLCMDIITLFSECPITASLLKDTADVNPAPKLINQLRINQTVSEEVRALANIVYVKWVGIVSPQQPESPVVAVMPKPSPLRNVRRNTRGAGSNVAGRGRGGRAQRILSNDIIEDSDDSSMESEEQSQSSSSIDDTNKKVAQPPVTVKIKIGVANNAAKVEEDCDKSPAEEDAPINLLKSLAEEVSENLNKEKAQKDKEKEVIGKRRKSEEEKKQKEKAAKEKEKEKEKEKKRKQQQAQTSQMDERERKRFRPDRRDEVEPEEKQRIKEKAREMLEQSKKDKDTLKKFGGSTPHTSSFSRIPKIPKKAVTPEDDKAKGNSFEAMLGNLDAKPKTVKTPMIKNKTAALLESFSKSKVTSENSSSSSKHHGHHHHHHHSSSSSSSPSGSKRESSSSSSRKEKESSSSSSSKKESSRRHHEEKSKSSSSSTSRPSKLIMPKRSSVDLESPKSGGKNTSFSESTGFMDAILNSMGGGVEEPKKKKRRLSERDEEPGKKSPKETPEKKSEDKEESMDTEEEEEQKPTFSFYRDTLEEPKDDEDEHEKSNDDVKEEPGSDGSQSPAEDAAKQSNGEGKKGSPSTEENMPFAEPEALPREVKGILVYHRGKEKRNKQIKFKSDSEIVSVKYFELDEDERINVNKINFKNMRQIELKMEKVAFKSKDSMGPEETDIDKWTRPVRIDVDNREPFTPGHGSKEKDIQFNREKTVLAAFLYSKETTPDTPSEPDASSMLLLASSEKPIFIPLDDLSNDGESNEQHDYSNEGWPEPHTNQVDRQANFDTDFSLNPALSHLLSSIENSGIFPPSQQQNLSQEELDIYKAQTEAIAKLGFMPGIDIPPSFPPPRGIPPPLVGGPPHGPPPMQQQPPPNMMPPMETNFSNFNGGPEFFGGGGPPPQGFGGPHFDRGRKFNNFHPGGGRGFPPHPNNRGFRGGGGPPMRGNADFYRER
jgi:protein phosphatase 1 regulatory subunit 10